MNEHGDRGTTKTAAAVAGLSLVIDPQTLVAAKQIDDVTMPLTAEATGGVPAGQSRRPGPHSGVVDRIDLERHAALFVPTHASIRARTRLRLPPPVTARPDDGEDTTSDEFGGDAA